MSKNHSPKTHLIRLQKYIADCGITSRRKAEELIQEGLVKVNGKKVTEMGVKVDPELDSVMVKGQNIDIKGVDHVYLVLNKPRACMTTVNDPEGRKTVMDCVKHVKNRVFPVGRLDYLSEGLLILTNDGQLANKIMHPSYEIVKTYEVKVFGKVNEEILRNLRKGIQAEDGLLKPESVRVVEQLPNKTWLEFRLKEGKNREIRRICEAFNISIDKLRRVAIGSLSIDGLAPGKWEYLSKKELYQCLGLNKTGTEVIKPMAYVSPRKSVNLKKYSKIQKQAILANDEKFEMYKKEKYYDTLKLQKEIREQKALAEKEKAQKSTQFVGSMKKGKGFKAKFK